MPPFVEGTYRPSKCTRCAAQFLISARPYGDVRAGESWRSLRAEHAPQQRRVARIFHDPASSATGLVDIRVCIPVKHTRRTRSARVSCRDVKRSASITSISAPYEQTPACPYSQLLDMDDSDIPTDAHTHKSHMCLCVCAHKRMRDTFSLPYCIYSIRQTGAVCSQASRRCVGGDQRLTWSWATSGIVARTLRPGADVDDVQIRSRASSILARPALGTGLSCRGGLSERPPELPSSQTSLPLCGALVGSDDSAKLPNALVAKPAAATGSSAREFCSVQWLSCDSRSRSRTTLATAGPPC